MKRCHCAWLSAGVLALAVLVQATPSQAAQAQSGKLTAAQVNELSRLLPNDTEAISTFNFRQLLDSALVKKYALEHVKMALKQDEVQGVLGSLGFDPLKDLEMIISASPAGGDPEKGLVIITGNFDAAKFQKKAKEVARANDGILKITKQGNFHIWEVSLAGLNLPNLPNVNLPAAFYVTIAEKNTVLMSASKAYLDEALDKVQGKKKTELKKEMAALLPTLNPKQTMAFLVLGSALAKADTSLIPEQFKPVIDQLKALKSLSGGIAVTDGIKMQIGLGTKDADTARQLAQMVRKGVAAAQGFVLLLAAQNEQLAPLGDIVKTIQAKTMGPRVTISAAISKELIENAAKMAKGGQ
jgi:hypothetical protein